MKLIKNNLKVIIGFVIGVILASSITVYAYNYFANDVGYTKPGSNTPISVEAALNELYSKSKNVTYEIWGSGSRRRGFSGFCFRGREHIPTEKMQEFQRIIRVSASSKNRQVSVVGIAVF